MPYNIFGTTGSLFVCARWFRRAGGPSLRLDQVVTGRLKITFTPDATKRRGR